MKDNPKLPKSKDLRGAVFDRWKQMVDAKMAQAGCKDINDSSVPVPTYDEDDNRSSTTRGEAEEWNAKDGWVRSALMDATIESNAWNLLSATESGRWNYRSLVDEYQGPDHLH